MKKLKDLLKIFLTFFKIGLFTFGGGYAMISMMEREFIDNKKWISHEEFLDVVAIAESTPGPIAINSATYIGYKQSGFVGSLFSTFGVVLPSFVIIFAISFFFEKFLSLTYVQYAFYGIQACVAFLILSSGIRMFKKAKKNVLNIVLCFASFVALILLNIFNVDFSTIYLIIIGGFIGLSVYLVSLVVLKNKEVKK